MRLHRWRLTTAFLALLLAITAIAPAVAPRPSRRRRPSSTASTPPTWTSRPTRRRTSTASPTAAGSTAPRSRPTTRRYGVFNELDDRPPSSSSPPASWPTRDDLEEGSDEWKAVQLFAQGIDIETRNAQGIEPIQPILDEMTRSDDLEDFHEFLAGRRLPLRSPGCSASSSSRPGRQLGQCRLPRRLLPRPAQSRLLPRRRRGLDRGPRGLHRRLRRAARLRRLRRGRGARPPPRRSSTSSAPSPNRP